MESEFVTPAVDRLTLSGEGRWIDVKHELNAGETQEMMGKMTRETPIGAMPVIMPEKVSIVKLLYYVVGWSFLDPNGRPVPVSMAAFGNLKNPTFNEMVEAVTAHEARIEQEQAALKKTPDGELTLATT